jgi:glycerol-3-phosphate acyltransferase PlsY
MNGPVGATALVLLGYLLGAVPVGVMVGRLTRGVDLRQLGSGSTGATNALRNIGPAAAVAVVALDVGKGVGAVLLARAWYQAGPAGSPEWVAAAAGAAAVLGHVRSVFIGFRGGRGMATLTGGMLAILPLVVAILLPVFGIVVWRWRFVSLGSVTVAMLAPIICAALMPAGIGSLAAVAYAAVGGAVVVAAHRSNIRRLLAGTERRIGK